MADKELILLHGYRYADYIPERPILNTWFVLNLNFYSPKITEIFSDPPTICLDQSSCARIGSSLYVLGGLKDDGMSHSNLVRCFDFRGSAGDGWKTCKPLAIPFSRSIMGVAGNLIYLFPRSRNNPDDLWGCCYDTSNQKSWIIKPPPPYCSDCDSPCVNIDSYPCFCAAFDFDDGNGNRNRGALVPITGGGHVYLYNPDENSWKSYCNSKLPNSCKSLYNTEYAVLNGLLYFSYFNWSHSPPNTRLYVYDIRNDQLLLDMTLPGFRTQDPKRDTFRFMVAIDDYKLCYLWYRNDIPGQSNKMTLYIANVDILPPSKSASYSEAKVVVDAASLLNCLLHSPRSSELVSSDSEREEVQRESRKRRSSKSSSRRKHMKQNEEDCCKEEIRKLRKEVQELKALILSQHHNNQS